MIAMNKRSLHMSFTIYIYIYPNVSTPSVHMASWRYAESSFLTLWAVCKQGPVIMSSSVRRTFTTMKQTPTSHAPSSEKWCSSVETAATSGTSGGPWHPVVSAACGCAAAEVSFGDCRPLLWVFSEKPTCPGDLIYVEQGPAFPPSCSNPNPAISNQDLVASCVCPKSERHMLSTRLASAHPSKLLINCCGRYAS